MMLSNGLKALAAAWVCMVTACAEGQAHEHSLRSSFATVGGGTSVPYGWVDFCSRYSTECNGPVLPATDVNLTSQALRQIDRVNRAVNAAVQAETDMDHWGVVDRWDYPLDGKGDCEDFALLKRKILIDAGYPRQALLMTVVKDHAGDGHAVLTVRTNKGEFVLDNMVDAMLPWDETGYRFVKRQSQEDPNLWNAIGPEGTGRLLTAR